MSPVTARPPSAEFCAQIVRAAGVPLPDPVAVAARRSLFNVLGTTVGAARSRAVEAIVDVALAEGTGGQVKVPGRAESLDPYWGALATGTAAHLHDFDDTHLTTVIHPGAAALAAMLALAPETGASGARCLSAFALGCEAQLRIGNAISPGHYDRGWHITGTCGVFGAAVVAAVLLGLDAAGLERALSLAPVMMLGHREAFGSMTKAFHAGKAAVNGTLAARLAAAGVPGVPDPLGPDGVLGVLTAEVDWRALLAGSWDGSGDAGWELRRNTFKPYPCGIVSHPLIDAAIEASARAGGPQGIAAVSVTCNPLVPELMGRRQPADGLQARFSAYHAVAVGLLDGEAGLAQFSDERAIAPDAGRMRDLITLRPTAECARDEATIRVERAGAEAVTVGVAHARGSLERPLTDAELLGKVSRLVSPALGDGAGEAIRDAVDALPGAPDLSVLLARLQPRGGRRDAGRPVGTPTSGTAVPDTPTSGAVTVVMPDSGTPAFCTGTSGTVAKGTADSDTASSGAAGPDTVGTVTTSEIVKLVTSAAPPAAALETAAAELVVFAQARREGADSEVAAAIRRIAPSAASPAFAASPASYASPVASSGQPTRWVAFSA
ncbi:MAG: MmgE/PrpD family protein, partial [Nocardiopsaceae bacterium]|nr:MmgE/PrpD family protein [Nocardiopsaceae bacterium]